MSGFDYQRTAVAAKRLIDRFGQVMRFSRTSPAGAITRYEARGLVASTVKSTIGESGIAVGDDKLLIEADAVPKPGDRVVYNDQSRVIKEPVITINPGGTRVLVECYAEVG